MTEAFGTLCANGLVLDNFSSADSFEDEQREDEIKKLLEEGLCNETFDCDSEDSDTASSAYNASKNGDDMFPSRQENSVPTKPEERGVDNQRTNSNEFKTTPSMDVFSISRKHNSNEINEASHSSAGNHSDPNFVKYHQRRLENADFHRDNDIKAMGDHFHSNSPKLSNGNGRHIPQTNEHDWENEEIDGKNPTISLMHTDHCPQNDGNVPSDMWLSAENNTEQLKSLCQFRERKILRSEEMIASLTKDKRMLNHQIGLMKSEMIQLKSQHDDLEKLMYLKDEEVAYLKTKIREAIDEFEQVRRREISSKDECSRLISENDKLQQEVKLLSAIGTSTQQAEINQLVRQMREKHARDNAAWQNVVKELEGQIRVYKRTQQLLQEESFTVVKRTVETQTENSVFVEECTEDEAREKAQAEKEFREEFGGVYENGTEATASAKVEEELRMQILEMQNKWDKEKKEIVDAYEIEIDAYRSRLSTLPAKLYETWQQTQEALRLSSPSKKKPESRSVTTSTDNIVEREVSPETNAHSEGERVSEKNSLNGAGDSNSPTNGRNEIQDGHKKSDNMEASSALIQPSPKETSSVIIQTEETLETYRVLAGLIEQWTTEVAQSSDRAKRAESLVSVAEEELNKLRKKFKYLQKMATSCRKEWKKQEDYLRKKNSDLKSHYMNILLKVNEKLEGIEIE